MAKKKDSGKKLDKKKKPANAIHLSALDGDASSLKILRNAEAEFVKKETKKKKRTPAQMEALRKRNRARVEAYEQRLKEKLKAKKQASKEETKDLQAQMRSLAKQNRVLKESKREAETETDQQNRLRAMIQRSLAERDKEIGAADTAWQAELDARDKRRVAQAAARRRAVREGRIPNSIDPYSDAVEEMKSLTEENAADFVPKVRRTQQPTHANLAGSGTAADQARRVRDAMDRIAERPEAKREDKTSSTAPLNDEAKAKTSTSTKKDKKESTVKVDKKAESSTTVIDGVKAAPVIIAPADNASLFSHLASINESIAASQERIADYMENLGRKAARDRTDQKLEKEQLETWWSQLLKNTQFDPEMEKKGRKFSDDANSFLSKFLSARMLTALKVMAAIAGGASLFNVGRKMVHRGKGIGLSIQAMLARATGNKEWLQQIEDQQQEHNANDPGSIGPVEGTLAALTALFVGNKVRKGYKLASTMIRNGKGMAGRVLGFGGSRAAAGAAAGAVEAGAGRAAAGVAGRGLLKGLLARAGARFAIGQAVGSAVPGIGNTVAAIAMAVWTIGDIAWSLMSDETKDKIKSALSDAWEATKDVAAAMGDKIMEWGRQAIGFIKDVWNGQELGTNFNTSSASAAAARNREATQERAIGEQGVRMTKGEAHRQAIANIPGYGDAIKKEREDATAQGKNWTFDTSKAFNDMMARNLRAPSGVGDAIAMSQADGGAGRLLDLIAKGESRGGAFGTSGYDAIWGGAAKYDAKPQKPISQMTLSEVLAYQKDLINQQKAAGVPAKRRSSAVGRYQFVHSTLAPLLAKLKIPHSSKFDAAMQDKLALALMDESGKGWSAFQAGKIDASTLANTVAAKWASFKNTDGQGVYNAAGFNHASIGADQVIAAVTKPNVPAPTAVQQPTAVPQANIPLPGSNQRVEPAYVPTDSQRGDIGKTNDNSGNAVSAAPPPMPMGQNRAPGLHSHSYVEDGALQLINYLGMA